MGKLMQLDPYLKVESFNQAIGKETPVIQFKLTSSLQVRTVGKDNPVIIICYEGNTVEDCVNDAWDYTSLEMAAAPRYIAWEPATVKARDEITSKIRRSKRWRRRPDSDEFEEV